MVKDSLTSKDRLFLAIVQQFFGHAVWNMLSALIGAILILLVLKSANIPTTFLTIWFCIIIALGLNVIYVEKRFKNSILTVKNAKKWVIIRVIAGTLISIMYGISPFLFSFSETVDITHEMFIFIIFSGMVSVSSTGYSVLPVYYIMINTVTMIPLTIYYFTQTERIYFILGITAIIWQIVVLAKALRVSRTSISAISLNEQLIDTILEHEETKKQLHHLATHDSLTGLTNRRFLTERLDIFIKESRRYQRNFALMFIDIDGLKVINDKYGHDVGDLLLKKISMKLTEHIRDTDIAARLGGDEFVIVYSELKQDLAEMESIVQRILNSIQEPFALPEGDFINVTGSIGIAFYPDNGDTADALLKSADDAMYHVKSTGKNNFSYSVS